MLEEIEASGGSIACLVRDSLSVSSSLKGNSKSRRASPESSTGNSEGIHGGLSWQLIGKVWSVLSLRFCRWQYFDEKADPDRASGDHMIFLVTRLILLSFSSLLLSHLD